MILALYTKLPSDLLLSPYVIKVGDSEIIKLTNLLENCRVQNDYNIIYVPKEIGSNIFILVDNRWRDINISVDKFREKEKSYFNYIANK